jgi:hypothetical protein
MADNRAPATKADIAELHTAMHADIAELRTELYRVTVQVRDRMESFETRIEGAVYDSQTEPLKAFYGFTETV